MGLDIRVVADNYQELTSSVYYDKENDYFHQHSLSRTFCNLTFRKGSVKVPELEQIGKITSVDIVPVIDMCNYPDEEGLANFIERSRSEAERKKILQKAEDDKNKVRGNIDKVNSVVSLLIKALNEIDDIPRLLLPTKIDTLNNNWYFADFKTDKGDGFIGNNFGQDLRNFKRFLDFAKERGTTTVWFNYG